jgi:hypothetical protein
LSGKPKGVSVALSKTFYSAGKTHDRFLPFSKKLLPLCARWHWIPFPSEAKGKRGHASVDLKDRYSS